MRAAALVETTAMLILAGALGAVSAEEAFKPGKWEFAAVVPEAGAAIGPNTPGFGRTQCITAANPLPPMARGPAAPSDENHPCKVERTEVNGATVSWSVTCATPQTIVTIDGIVRYHGMTADGQYTVRTAVAGRPPVDRATSLTGRYLGPCDGG
ncbi:MAG TPA: DUF3617 family protein [Stellaceae bacterium]